MRFCSTKTYGHNIGLSCAFRQWRADSHCRLLHGYALAFKFVFEARELDHRNWVVDFGGLKSLKQQLELAFDHATIVASDDPELAWFQEAERRGIARVIVTDGTGCERFAEFAYNLAASWLERSDYADRVVIRSVEVMEHGANSAIVERERRTVIKETALGGPSWDELYEAVKQNIRDMHARGLLRV